MKRSLALILAFCLLLGLPGCQQGSAPSSPAVPPAESEEAPPPVKEPSPATDPEQQSYWAENLPPMDGSTSLIPLEAAIRSALLGISMEEATAQVAHTTTHGSFNNLLQRSVDLIFSVPLSEYQEQQAKDLGIQLEQVPVAREGFVFVVNAKNPVDGLTQQQLRDIYSGKITNWSQVGGKDEPIIAYQRNRDSGSQNYMSSFMGDTPLMDAPIELRPGTMGGLMDVIAVNDHAEQSIGYSVYAYAADMYGNGDEIKFLAIDGVAPSKATMASGTYPLLSENYAIFRADEPADSPVRKLCDWMSSDEGQLALAQGGYVTLRDVGYDYSLQESPLEDAYSATGSGYLESWETPIWKSTAAEADRLGEFSAALPLNITLPKEVFSVTQYDQLTPYTTGITYELDCLVDQELQGKINAFLKEAVAEADARSGELFDYVDSLNSGEYLMYCQVNDWLNGMGDFYPSAIVSVKAKNGYIWATVSQMYLWNAQDGYDKYFSTQCRTWDLFSGEEVPVEGLFPKGLDVDEYLNDFLRSASQSPIDSWGTYPQMKADFVRLPEIGWALSPEAIYIDLDNPYFGEGLKFSLEGENDVLCSAVFRDMTGLFSGSASSGTFLCDNAHEPVHAFVHDELFNVQLLDESVGNSAVRAAINEDFLQKLEPLNRKNAVAYFNSMGHPQEEASFESWMYSWGLREYGDSFALFYTYYPMEIYISEEPYHIKWPASAGSYLYDLQSGEALHWQDLLAEGWEDSADLLCYDQEFNHVDFHGDLTTLPPLSDISISYNSGRSNPLLFSFIDWAETAPGQPHRYELYLPLSALKLAEELPR